MKEYKIAHRGLGEGTHSFDFILDRTFFDCFDETKGTEGKIQATVQIVKSALLMEVKLEMDGLIEATCDRCLGIVNLHMAGKMNLYVKQNEREEGNDDDFIVLAPDEDFIDLSLYLYELYMLNYPIRVAHPEGECDQDMEKVLDEYVIDEDTKPTDPRWDELKKLINN